MRHRAFDFARAPESAEGHEASRPGQPAGRSWQKPRTSGLASFDPFDMAQDGKGQKQDGPGAALRQSHNPRVTSTPSDSIAPPTHWHPIVRLWPSAAHGLLFKNQRHSLVASPAWLRVILARPELALVEESCPAEIALHHALHADPLCTVAETQLAALQDDDARANYRFFVQFRDGLVAAGSLEAWYLQLFRSGPIQLPPLFIDWVAQACVHNALEQQFGNTYSAMDARAAEMLFRPQRVSVQEGRILAGDRAVLDLLYETGGLGDIGRLLAQSGAALQTVELHVLNDAIAPDYWDASDRHHSLLDLTHEHQNTLSHGLTLSMVNARSGLKSLARVLQAWVAHFLGVQVTITPLPRVDDAAWRWHIGLDSESTALLNDLYEGADVSAERQQRLLSLFKLQFNNPQDMRADLVGKTVYLGLAMNAQGLLTVKPQNLLLNLPLREPV